MRRLVYMFQIQRHWWTAIVGCLFLVAMPASGVADSLDDLLRDYREYGLPEPPKEARLVRFFSGSWTVGKDGAETPYSHLGFLLQPGDERHGAVVLVGTVRYETRPKEIKIVEIDPNTVSLKNVHGEWTSVAFGINAGLATALQCKARGWDKLAQRLWDQSIRETSGHFISVWCLHPNQPPKTALAMTAWVYYMNQLMEPNTDRRAILDRMKLLISREPKLNNETNQALLKCLQQALVPSRAKPGTPEALIDGLVEWCGSTSIWSDDTNEDPRLLALTELGFDAAPALIEHLNDGRLTRSYMPGFNNSPARPLCVGQIVADILQRLSGYELDRDFLDRLHGEGFDKAKAREWFAKASKIGEEKYLVENALPAHVDERADEPNRQILTVLAKKYPGRFPEIYRRLLRGRPEMASDSLAKLIANGPMIKAQKIELFRTAAETADLRQRTTALRQLKDLDHEHFVAIVVKTLEGFEKKPKNTYLDCPESELAGLVAETGDPRVWQSLAKAARRVDVGLRMEIINNAGWGDDDKAPEYRRRLEFFAGFLNDETVRTLTGHQDDFFRAGKDFPRLEVRDFAAMQIASILNTGDTPNKRWTAKDWADFRTRIRERLSREKIVLESSPLR
jgi:hypothetical protein